ncbi:GIY-YIG nuclease family protein [Psychroflexus montanilacus]|uniref:GIY-YIG nuclease family protein n=1 Tax=Psychroflexus montanilacus TaxID=2873598 RepID=UPI001CCAA217|nr:GIY-YIG nuclease family protein [Psychroflexus montanilacus]MBZ9652162.1 GIY-YIG nuclease family protein [Psychroflexus montanilacus]
MHFLYIIYSKQKDKFYVGETSDADFRVNLHNQHQFKGAFTKIADDWKLVLSFQCQSKNDAILLEKFIKRMKSRKFIKKIIEQPEILKDILNRK